MNLKKKIRNIPDFPVKGVNFKDITPLLQDGKTFQILINKLIKPFSKTRIDRVVAIDARGFLLGAPIAYKIGCGVSLIRKKGKLPYKTIEEKYLKEYGPDILSIHSDTIKPKYKVLMVDDLLATGGTMIASIKLVEKLGGKIVGITCIIDLPFLNGSKKLTKYKLNSLVRYEKE